MLIGNLGSRAHNHIYLGVNNTRNLLDLTFKTIRTYLRLVRVYEHT